MIKEDVIKEISYFQNKVQILEKRKIIFEKMEQVIESLDSDEKQALYELLNSEYLEDNIGWSDG